MVSTSIGINHYKSRMGLSLPVTEKETYQVYRGYLQMSLQCNTSIK